MQREPERETERNGETTTQHDNRLVGLSRVGVKGRGGRERPGDAADRARTAARAGAHGAAVGGASGAGSVGAEEGEKAAERKTCDQEQRESLRYGDVTQGHMLNGDGQDPQWSWAPSLRGTGREQKPAHMRDKEVLFTSVACHRKA